MATTTKPPKKRTLYNFPTIQYAANPGILNALWKKRVVTQATNILNEAPTTDKIYIHNGKNYGRPQFRLFSEESKNDALRQKGFRYTKDDNGLHLNVILEAYHTQVNVIPLDFRQIRIVFQYEGKSGTATIPFTISNILPVNKINVLKYIYAHAVVKEEDIKVVHDALVTDAKESKLLISADVWWQKPESNKPTPPPRPKPKNPPVIAETCAPFNRGALRIQGTHVFSGNKRLMSFRNFQDAKKAFTVIHHYKMDRRCSVGGNQFSYFLSGNAAPTGTIKGEDCLPFNPAKLKVIQANGRWKITDGRSWMFDFNTNKSNAVRALAIIKKHGFDATCYIGRPKPGMTYLKRTRNPNVGLVNLIIAHNMTPIPKFQEKATLLGQLMPINTKAQKVTVNSEQILDFESKDPSVFQGFSDELESKIYKWHHEPVNSLNLNKEPLAFNYRLTNERDKVFFLPQDYRIGINTETGDPDVHINMYEHEDSEGKKEYRIKMDFTMKPYIHPSAKKDLRRHLAKNPSGEIKYIENFQIGGYRDAYYEVEDRFSSNKVSFSEKFTEKIQGIDPYEGFTITADHSLESFDVFRNDLLSDGINIGKVFFELEEIKGETLEEKKTIIKSRPITVKLNLNKLVDMPSIMADAVPGGKHIGATPLGFLLKNTSNNTIKVENVELTLISKHANFIYDVDFDVKALNPPDNGWLSVGGESKSVFIDPNSIGEKLSDENAVWGLLCEPYGTRVDIDPDKILATVIDRATNEPEMWKLDVSCPFFEEPEKWSAEQKEPFKNLKGILVEIKVDEPENDEIFSVELNETNPRQEIEMARTLRQLLDRSKHENQKYIYRQTNITDPKSEPGEWKPFESFAVKHLRIDPVL